MRLKLLMAQQQPQRGGRNTPAQHQHSVIAQRSIYQGAIPPPDMMEHFARIDPTLPGRIIAMAENEGSERRLKERSIIKKAFQLDLFSTSLGFLAVVGAMILSYQFLIKGYPSQAAAVATGVIVALAIVFVLRRKPSSESKEKSK